MANVVVVGAQWGDEGKGKIVDWLSVAADVVVRFQGGHNAGHTLVVDGKTYKLALLPSGIVRPGKLSVIGNGVVLDPYHLIDEIEKIRAQGVEVTPNNLKIAENVPLILALHRELDAHRESADFGGVKIGTTKRGIGPAYEDKVGRRAIRLMDLAEPESLDGKIARLLAHHEPLRRGMGLPAPTAAAIKRRTDDGGAEGAALHGADLRAAGRRAPRRQAHPVRGRAGRAARRRPRHLSLRHLVEHRRRRRRRPAPASGRAPSATCSASPRPTRRASAAGRSRPNSTTRSAARIGQRGAEFGTNTGRPRRCGWFDAVLTRQTVKTSGIDGVALTKLDMLDGFETIKVCSRYRLDGEEIDYLPASQAAQARVEPIYETIEGWSARHRRRALLGRLAGAGGQIRAPDRGTDRRAGCVALDESRSGKIRFSCTIHSKTNPSRFAAGESKTGPKDG